MTFYQCVKLLCEERGVTPAIMAKRIGVSYHTVRKWRYVKSLPRWATIIKLSDYFRVPREYFLDTIPSTKKAED